MLIDKWTGAMRLVDAGNPDEARDAIDDLEGTTELDAATRGWWEAHDGCRAAAGQARCQLGRGDTAPRRIFQCTDRRLGVSAADDNFIGPIVSSTELRLLEIKVAQWRGRVWKDLATGVHWLVVAGLAKGEHQGRDDFYQRVEREQRNGDPTRWLPTPDDERLLKQETAARLITEWGTRGTSASIGCAPQAPNRRGRPAPRPLIHIRTRANSRSSLSV